MAEDKQQYKRVLLLPIDDSEDSENTVIWALENLFRPGGDLLYFLHVVPERQFEVIGGDAAETIVEEDVSAEQQVVEDAKNFITNRILQLAEQRQAPNKVEIVRFRTDAKSVGDVIIERAATLGAAAVVMKKHAVGAIRAFFVGSATEHVAQHCKQPVVVLH
ncbi:g5105 [Coccomyxa viridis]|uniref:G5105 protein n=1 Tax=Coccomyxa viridis TaxID=1274662 RepID=A0ABP1FWY4_9CHLO